MLYLRQVFSQKEKLILRYKEYMNNSFIFKKVYKQMKRFSQGR